MQESTTDNTNRTLSFREFFSTLKWMVIFNFRLSPWVATAQVVIRFILSAGPILNAYIFARLIDKVIHIAAAGENFDGVFPLLGLLLGFNLILAALRAVYTYVVDKMGNFYLFKVPIILVEKIHSLGIQTLENPSTVNKIQRARETIGMLNTDFERLVIFISNVFILVSTFSIIVHTIPLVAVIVSLAVLPEVISNRIFMRKSWSFWREHTEERRKTNAIIGTLSETANLQEISITGAFDSMKNLFTRFTDFYSFKHLRILKQWHISSFIFGSFADIASMFGYFTILKNLFNKLISVGDVTFQMRILDMFVTNISNVTNGFSGLYERAIRISETKIVFDMQPMVEDGTVVLSEDKNTPHIAFNNVSFTYPNSDKLTIKNLSIEIKPGEKIAIVGENGAGKTTLIKLLSRFYKTTEGSITLDGTSINDITISSWYKHLGVLFQDYNTYNVLSVKQNIHLGRGDRPIDMKEIETAAAQADVTDIVKGYKDGYDQILSEKFKGGTRPSTGQWQKIAIARFFYRNSPVVVFDEPTASIDAVSEAEIFGKIYDFFTGKTVIIISHRFSTVRNADKIYVLDKGEILESGSHEELMKIKGKYYKAFNIQAKGYK